jgi:fatty-acyl-CoA synthase
VVAHRRPWAPNCAEGAFVQIATPRLGTIVVNINSARCTQELSYLLEQAGISVLGTAHAFETLTTGQ